MLDSQKVKDFLYEECGAEIVGVAPAGPFSEDNKKRVLESQAILKSANPSRSAAGIYNPEDFLENAKTVIVFGRNSFFGPEFKNDSSKIGWSARNDWEFLPERENFKQGN